VPKLAHVFNHNRWLVSISWFHRIFIIWCNTCIKYDKEKEVSEKCNRSHAQKEGRNEIRLKICHCKSNQGNHDKKHWKCE
jgi:hypothetical protein